MLSRRAVMLLLMAILVLAFGLRLRGMTYGIPGPYVPDEYQKIQVVMDFDDGQFAHRAHQPSFLFNTVYLACKVAAPFEGRILRGLGVHTLDPELHKWFWRLWVGRLWMIVLSTATAWVVFLLGRRVATPEAGLFGALVFALSPLSIGVSHYLKEDTPLALWTTVALLACLNIVERGRWRDYLLAGLLCGVAFGAKFPGALALFAVLGAHLLYVFGAPEGVRPAGRKVHLRPVAAFGISIIGFAITSPAIFLTLKDVGIGVYYQVLYMRGGHHDGIRISGLEEWFTFYLRRGLWPGMAGLPLIAAIVGLRILWSSNRRAAILLAGWAAGYYLIAEAMPAKPYPFFARYVLPVVPVLAVGSGVLLAWLATLGSLTQGKVTRRIVWGIVAAIMIYPVVSAALFCAKVLPDTRDRAADWLERRSERYEAEPLLLSDAGMFHPYFPQPAYGWQRDDLTPEILDQARTERRTAYIVLSSFVIDRYLENPDDVPDRTEFYREVMKIEEPMKTYTRRRGKIGFHNPDIHIYRLWLPPLEESQ